MTWRLKRVENGLFYDLLLYAIFGGVVQVVWKERLIVYANNRSAIIMLERYKKCVFVFGLVPLFWVKCEKSSTGCMKRAFVKWFYKNDKCANMYHLNLFEKHLLKKVFYEKEN